MTISKILLGAGLALALPLAALAAPGGAGPDSFQGGRPGGWHDEAFAFLHGIQLTETQRTQVHQLIAADRQQSRPIEQQLHALHKQITDAMLGTGTLNTAELTAWSQKVAELRAQLDGNRLSTAIQVRALLTADQLTKAATIHQQLETLHTQERQILGAGHANGPNEEN